MFDSDLCVSGKLFGSFFDALIVNEHDPGHHHRLRLSARIRQPSLDQQFVDALSSHTGDITLERAGLSHVATRLPHAFGADNPALKRRAKFNRRYASKTRRYYLRREKPGVTTSGRS
jgi:hypothetical protein